MKKPSKSPSPFSLLPSPSSLLPPPFSLPYPDSRPTIAGIETKVPIELPKLDRKNTNKALVILFW